MDLFYVIVLAIAVIFLIIVLTTITLSIKEAVKERAYPPFKNTCPDYWTASSIQGESAVCTLNPVNVGVIGTTVDGKKIELTNSPTTDPSLVYTPGWDAANKTVDFGNTFWSTGFNGLTPTCAQKQWATINSIQWDGITNSNMKC